MTDGELREEKDGGEVSVFYISLAGCLVSNIFPMECVSRGVELLNLFSSFANKASNTRAFECFLFLGLFYYTTIVLVIMSEVFFCVAILITLENFMQL